MKQIILLLLLAPVSFGHLQCETPLEHIDTVRCFAVGGRNNYIVTDFLYLNPLAIKSDAKIIDSFAELGVNTIKTLLLSNANLIYIDANLFRYFDQLKSLDISGNPKLKLSVIEYTSTIEDLNISDLNFHSDVNALKIMPNIRSLKISKIDHAVYSQLLHTYLNQMFEIFQNLEILDVSHNHMLNLDVCKANFNSKLRFLDISHLEAVIIKEDCFTNATGLKTLIISNSQVSKIPKSAFHGVTLKHLDVSNNRLTKAAMLSITETMVKVNISHNRITRLEESIKNVFGDKLEILDVSNNRISEVHFYVFLEATSLIVLILSHNKLREIKFLGYRNENIKILDVSYNLIESLEPDTFLYMKDLDKLDLSNNLLTFLPNKVFFENKYLSVLILKNNNLKTLTIAPFITLRVLSILDLSGNRLEHIPDDWSDMPGLKELNISCNRLSILPNNFEEVRYLKAALHGNPWNCACLSNILKSVDFVLDAEYILSGLYPSCLAGEGMLDGVCGERYLTEDNYTEFEDVMRINKVC